MSMMRVRKCVVELLGSILGSNFVIGKDVKKLNIMLLCHMRDINSIGRGNALAENRCNLLPCIHCTGFKTNAYNQRVDQRSEIVGI